MFSKSELLDAIDELEMAPATYQNCEKLATFYTLYEHLYTTREPIRRTEPVEEIIISAYGDSEFLTAIRDKPAKKVWPIIDELMEAIKALQPRLYNATLERFQE